MGESSRFELSDIKTTHEKKVSRKLKENDQTARSIGEGALVSTLLEFRPSPVTLSLFKRTEGFRGSWLNHYCPFSAFFDEF